MNSLIKKLLIVILALGAVAAVAGYGRKAYRRATEHHLVSQAGYHLKTNDVKSAELCLRRALQLDPMSLPATRMVADLLDNAGAPTALSWRIRVAQLEPDNVTNRFEWAEAALKLDDLKSAGDALDGVAAAGRICPPYFKLRGALAWSRHDTLAAEKYYSEAARLEPDNLAVKLNLDTIHLSSTNHEIAQAARISLEQLTTNSTWRPNALEDLLKDAVARRNLPEALTFSKELACDPDARFGDKIEYLQLLKVSTNTAFEAWFASLELEATNSPARAFALGRWMATAEGPTNALHWLEGLSPSIRASQPVPLLITDCQIALKDWRALLQLVNSQDWTDGNFYRLAVESLANRALGEEYTSQSAWRGAMRQSAHRLDRLSRLAQVTAAWNWRTERTEALREIVSEFPKEKWAADALMAELYATGDTRGLMELLTKRFADDPADARIKNNLATLYLLRKDDLNTAYRLADEAYQSAPKDPFFTATYAYSLLLQKKPGEALKAFNGLKTEYLKIPSIAAYYGVVQAEAGHKDAAQAPLRLAKAAKLLPEEKEMVRLAEASL